MESPLTVFIYVLMRDHLATGTVRWLIEQSQLPGDPVYSAPELEALAERYAAELLLAPPRNGAASDSSPPIEEEEEPEPEEAPRGELRVRPRRRGIGGVPAIATRIEEAMLSGEWMKTKEIAEAVELSVLNIRQPLQAIVREGAVEAQGATATRRYRLLPVEEEETSEPDHDDAGKGDVPGDPAGETEEGEGASSASAAESDSTESMQQPPRDGGGEQSGSLPGAPTAATGSRARGDQEEDVALMARVGDYIQQAAEPVFAGEIEAIFGLSAQRRRTVIEMLLERHRIEQRGNAPRATYVYRDTAKELPEETSAGHFRQPQRQEQAQLRPDAVERFKSWALGQRTFKKRTVIEAFPEFDSTAVGPMLSRLAGEGFLKSRNEDGHLGGGISYEVAQLSRSENGDHGVTLEGRMMGLLDGEWVSADFLATKAACSRDDAVITLDKLVREGMIRRERGEGGRVSYAAT